MQFHKILENSLRFCIAPNVVGPSHNQDDVRPVYCLVQTPTKALSELPSYVFHGKFVSVCNHLLGCVPTVTTNGDLAGAKRCTQVIC